MFFKGYDSFIASVDFTFGDRNDIENKTFLNHIMRRRGYFNAKNHKKRQIQAQKLTTKAWIYLKYNEDMLSFVKPSGFKKRQIRDKKTGKILGWE